MNSERLSNITVFLLREHIAQLDYLSLDIRVNHGRFVSRSGLVGALIEAAVQSNLSQESILKLVHDAKSTPPTKS